MRRPPPRRISANRDWGVWRRGIDGMSLTRRIALSLGFLGLLPLAFSSSGQARDKLHGIVRNRDTGEGIEGASVYAEGRSGGSHRTAAVSDGAGLFSVPLPADTARVWRLIIRRIGFLPETSTITRAADTVAVWLRPVPVALDGVRIAGRRSVAGRALEDARARGWRVYPEEQIAPLRVRARGFADLVRALGIPGVVPPRRPGDCLRSARNLQCLAVIVDGFNVGTDISVVSGDVAFIALVGLTEARMFFGPLAPNGAIVVYTREGPSR